MWCNLSFLWYFPLQVVSLLGDFIGFCFSFIMIITSNPNSPDAKKIKKFSMMITSHRGKSMNVGKGKSRFEIITKI